MIARFTSISEVKGEKAQFRINEICIYIYLGSTKELLWSDELVLYIDYGGIYMNVCIG